MPGKPLHVAIAGGGIGGLTAALALARHGISSQIFERRAASSEDGAGIQIGPNGSKILERLGVADRLRAMVAAPDALSVRDGMSGREMTVLPLGRWIAERHGAPYWTAHRQHLHAALLAAADAEPLIVRQSGVEIVGVENRAAGISVRSADGSATAADALIAADGLWSKLRATVAVDATPQPVGKAAFRSVVPASALPISMTANAVHIWLTPGAHAVHYPVNAGRDIALVVIFDDATQVATWAQPVHADAVIAITKSFAAPLRALIASAQEWRMWSLHTLQPLAHWSDHRTVLLGDAAHPVLPFLAQGAVLAMEDSVVLAQELARSADDIAAALTRYETARRARVLRVAAASRRNGRIYHMSGASALARNAVMAMMPSSRLMAGYDWLYGWQS